MIRIGIRTCFRCGAFFFLWSLVRLNCARNSGVEHVSRPEGCDLKAEGLEPYHEYCMSCGCVNSSTSSPWAPYFMCSCVLLSPGRFGPSRAQVCLGFAVVGWFTRFRPSPPPLVWFRFRLPPFFFFLALSGFARGGPGFQVLVFPLSLCVCVPPLRVVVKYFSSHRHFHLIFISFPFHFHFIVRTLFHTLLREGVCVWNILRDVKLLLL